MNDANYWSLVSVSLLMESLKSQMEKANLGLRMKNHILIQSTERVH